MTRRFIEQYLPIWTLGKAAVKEQGSTRRISMIHRWWARRKQGVSRVTILASLLNEANGIEFEEKKNLIEKLSFLNETENFELLQKAQELIKKDRGNLEILFWDPFSGGGSLPAEAQRLGLKVLASDLNPVSILIQKASYEYPALFGMVHSIGVDKRDVKTKTSVLGSELRNWGNYVIENAIKELAQYYPPDEHGNIPSIYFWCHTIECSNPSCNKQMPLQKQPLLSKKRKIALKISTKDNDKIYSEIITGEDALKTKGLTGSQGVTNCIFCNQQTAGKIIRQKAESGGMNAVCVAKMINRNPKEYLPISNIDLDAIELSKKDGSKINKMWIPTVRVDEYSGRGKQRGIGLPHKYGIHTFKDFFLPRQLIAVTTIMRWIESAKQRMIEIGKPQDLIQVLCLYLALSLDKFAEYNTRLTVWHALVEVPSQTASRYSFDVGWDFPEVYPFTGGSGSFNNTIDIIADYLDKESQTKPSILKIWQQDAAVESPIPEKSIDIVVTDPPYYESIFYAGLSDFFYSLLKITQTNAYPELFSKEATPKLDECVMATHRYSNTEDARKAYEKKLTCAFKEINRILKPNGICVIVFAHIDLDAWDALITSILNANLIITASWPVTTENAAAFGGGGTTLSSTQQIVCRQRPESAQEIIFDEFKQELKKNLPIEFDRLWNLQFSGVNLDIAMLGPAISFFSHFKSVLDLETGENVKVSTLLNYVRTEVLNLQWQKLMNTYLTDLADQHTLQQVDPITRFYVLFRVEFGQKINADGVFQLSKAISLDYKSLEQWGYLQKIKQEYWVPTASHREHPELLIAHQGPISPVSLIDILHGAILANKGNITKQFLAEAQIDPLHPMWALAQLTSNITPIKDERTELLDLLSNRGKDDFKRPKSLDDYLSNKK